MSASFRVVSWSLPRGFFGVIFTRDGSLSYSTGPHKSRTEARAAAVRIVHEKLMGEVVACVSDPGEMEGARPHLDARATNARGKLHRHHD